MSNKLFVLIRGDLSKAQQAAQACHAVAGFMLYENKKDNCSCGRCDKDFRWENETIVLLKVKDLDDLKYWYGRLLSLEECYTYAFNEPYYSDAMTAIAAYGNTVEDILKDIPLI